MGRLGPITSLGLGRSPYDEVVPGEGPEDSRSPQQLYDERGRPINPETKRINRDVIRSHNEVMMVIGVAEPENSAADAQLEAARRHHQYEDRIGRRLLLAGGVLESAAIWGVNGMRQRILLYKPYSQTTFYGMFQLAWSQQSVGSYFFGGLPSFLASTLLEQLPAPELKKTTFWVPNWRFFIPGTSISPIPIPPTPISYRPRTLLGWFGTFALGVAPFAGFYLYTKFHTVITKTLRYKIHQLLPRPHNPHKRRHFPTGAEVGSVEHRTDESPASPTAPTPTTTPNPSATPAHRRQSTVSLRGDNSADQPPFGSSTQGTQDDFASDDEDNEIISATLISFDVEATDPTTPLDPTSTHSAAHNGGGDDATPGAWSAELRPNPNLGDANRGGGGGDYGFPGEGDGANGSSSAAHDNRVYRENVLTRLPAILATDVLAITPARLLMTPLASLVWGALARPYMRRMGMPMEGVVGGAGWWWGLRGARGMVNMLGLELLLAVMQCEAWAVIMLAAEQFRFTAEEWNEKEGLGGEGEGEEEREMEMN
ncbi:hypothetical protein F5144DRAFT_620093 [Chaetomium tenue]|uniref:Uncharacterized protein n=1 Tax=Chaetomium tenue TaxID=1854479 RepID=A0ACB7PD49_9PEZI|nr:hypothetical protein F5144DRAFT_620093 [Chaetomium globosum]